MEQVGHFMILWLKFSITFMIKKNKKEDDLRKHLKPAALQSSVNQASAKMSDCQVLKK